MSNLSGAIEVLAQELFVQNTVQQHEIGQKAFTRDGRTFRYVQAGEALVAGTLVQAPAQIANHQNLTVVSGAAGAKSLVATLGNTLASVNQYAGGFVIVTIDPGEGYAYKISGHAAADALGDITLSLEDAIQVAVTTTSRVDLVPNPYLNVVINPVTATGLPCGAAIDIIASSSFGWVQTSGPAPVLVDDQTVVVGTSLSASNQAAGAVEPFTGVQAMVGRALTGGATTDRCLIWLSLE